MANPEDLEKEISRLWARVSGPGGSPEPSMEPVSPQQVTTGGELAWETLSILKRQHSRQSKTWAEMLEAKEQALKITRERLLRAEQELMELRKRLETEDGRVMSEVMDAHARVSEAQRALQNERKTFTDDMQAMRELVEEARRAAAADAARFKGEQDRWNKREQQYLVDLAELQALAARRNEEAGKADGTVSRLEGSLKEAKNALEKTLAELLRERKIREESEAGRAKALAKVDEVQKHFDELSRIWEEERAQWRELWDRERSTWEAKRQELASWEETLRKEREAWQTQSAAVERDQARYAEQVTRTLRESSESGAHLAAVMKRLADLESPASGPISAPRPWGKYSLVLASAALACYGGWWLSAWTLKPLSAQTVAMDSPTGLAQSGGLVWLSDWEGRLSAYAPGDLRAPVRQPAVPAVGSPYRPAGIEAGENVLWTLDTAQARIIRHDAKDPMKVLAQRPAPGPAPTALAYDGKNLWSYDAANRSLYRHGEDEGTYKAFTLDDDSVPTAMSWVEGRLWVYDSKSRSLRVYSLEGDRFEHGGSMAVEKPVLSLATAGKDTVLALTGGSVIKYRHARRFFTIF